MTDEPAVLSPSEVAAFAAAQSKFNASLSLAVVSTFVAFGIVFATDWPRAIPFVVIVVGWLPFYAVAYLVRRCPRCNKALGNRPSPQHCSHCGVRFFSDDDARAK